VLAQIDRTIRAGFWDPTFHGVDWGAAVSAAAADLARAGSETERNAVYDRLLARLEDSHTFRVPPGRLPDQKWATAGLRIGRDGDGYAVKGTLPDSSAEKAGMRLGDRVFSVAGKRYGAERVNFRDLFLVFEGAAGTSVEVSWKPANGETKTESLRRLPEDPGDALVYRSARVFRRDGKVFAYARLWGISSETALAVVDMLLDRRETARLRPELAGLEEAAGFLLDVRANSGGYDPDILATFLRGRWSSGDYFLVDRFGKRLFPATEPPPPAVLLVNSGTASAAEALALKFRAHGIGPIVGEPTAGMASGGSALEKLSDGSLLWYSRRTVESLDGRRYEGAGVEPDVAVADRPAAEPGGEDAVVEAAWRALASRPLR
jgi:C-terminal processing protease CtpA/Prc